jgi:hypothetical protein
MDMAGLLPPRLQSKRSSLLKTQRFLDDRMGRNPPTVADAGLPSGTIDRTRPGAAKNTSEELACTLAKKTTVITTMSQDDQLALHVVVHGIDSDTFEELAIRFDCRRGGVRPQDGSRYISIPVTQNLLSDTFLWIKSELKGCYRELYLGVSVNAKLSWSEIIIPAEIALLAGQYQAVIKVLFSS